MKSNKGSALLVAILLSAILLAALAGLLTVALNEYRGSLKSYFNTAAFSLAESGVDRAAAAIVDKFSSATTLATGDAWPTAESVSTPTWYKKTSSGKTLYRGYFPAENLDKGRKGVCSVLCIEQSTTSYEVYAHGTVRGGEAGKGIEAQRAIKVEFTKKTGSGGGAGFALAAISNITSGQATTWPFKKGDSTGFLRIGSFDSWKSKKVDEKTKRKIYDAPNWLTQMTGDIGTLGVSYGNNFGDKAIIAVKTGKVNLNNTILYGTAAAAMGASIETKSHYSADGTKVDNDTDGSTIVNLDIAKTNKFAYIGLNADAYNSRMEAYDIGVDKEDSDVAKNSRLVNNYKIDDSIFATPTLPSDFATTKTDAKTKRKDDGTLTLGSGNYEWNGGMDNVNAIHVNGNAVLHVTQNINAVNGNGLALAFDTDDSTLRIVVDSNVNIKIASTGASYAAKQFQLDSTSNSGVTINLDNTTKGFTGVIKAPLGTVQFSGNVDRDDKTTGIAGTNRQYMIGQIIAKDINLPGSCNLDVLFDVQLSGGGEKGTKLSVSTWKQVLPSDFLAQL